MIKLIYSEKATKFCKISTLYLTVCTVVKFKVEISQNFVAFSEYMNFTQSTLRADKFIKNRGQWKRLPEYERISFIMKNCFYNHERTMLHKVRTYVEGWQFYKKMGSVKKTTTV